jgi:hypothetical protein
MSRRFLASVVALAFLILAPSTARAQATPDSVTAEGVTATTVCVADVPAEHLPAGPAVVSFTRFLIDDRTSVEAAAGQSSDSVSVDCMVTGRQTLTIDGPSQVIRAGAGPPEEIEPGTEVTVDAGEVLIVLENESPQRIAYSGAGTIEIFNVWIASTESPPCLAAGDCLELPSGFGGATLGTIAQSEWASFDGSAVRLTVRQLELAPGAAVVVPEERYSFLWYVQEGELSVDAVGDGSSTVYESGRRLAASRLPAGELRLHNAGEEAVTLYELSVVPLSVVQDPAATPTA